MAYMNQEKKTALSPAIKKVLKKYGVKGTLAVRNYSSLVLNIKSGKLDFIGDANKAHQITAERRGQTAYEVVGSYQVNEYYAAENAVDKKIGRFFAEIVDAMNGKGATVKNHNNSDIMTDYFDVGWYIDINVGQWNKPYVLEK